MADGAISPSAFAYRDFPFWLAFRYFSGVGLQIKNVAVGWHVYETTGSAVALGLVGLASFLPSFFLALVTGHVADTRNRLTVVVVGFSVCAAAMLALTVAIFTGAAPLWLVYLCVALIGAGRAFANPAAQAVTPNLVPREAFANAITWFSSIWQFAIVSGPAIGGLLFLLGTWVVFAAGTAAFVACVMCALMLRTPLHPANGKSRGPVTWAALSAGIVFMWSTPVVFGAVALDLVAVMFGGVAALLPIVAKDILAVGPEGLGFLRSAPAIGAIATGLLLARYPILSGAGRKMLVAVAVFGLAAAIVGLSPWFWLTALMLVVTGAADQVSVVIRHTMVQSDTPDEMRGRVAAVSSVFVAGSGDLGEFRAGMSAALFGVGPAIVIGGVGTMIVAWTWPKLFPGLAARDKLVH